MTNRIALITGGSRGLGKNAALALAKKNVDSIITYHSQHGEADQVVKEIEALGAQAVALQLDIAEAGSFNSFIDTIKGILAQKWQREDLDILVNNAGIGIHKPFAETTETDFDTLVNIQFKGPFFLTQKMLPVLKDGGNIINISSGLARFSTPGYSAYAAMKGAMETLTRYQAKELGARGIRVNIVAPGAIETDFGGGVVRDNKQLNSLIASQTALGRVGLPDDIGGVIALLCMPEMSWVTAQRIEASGGMFL